MKETNTEIGAVKIAPAQIPDLVTLVNAGTISNTIAKTVFEEMYQTGKDARAIVAEKDWRKSAIAARWKSSSQKCWRRIPKQVAEYLGGKETIAKFLVGQVMKATKGQAHPGLANELVIQKLNGYLGLCQSRAGTAPINSSERDTDAA